MNTNWQNKFGRLIEHIGRIFFFPALLLVFLNLSGQRGNYLITNVEPSQYSEDVNSASPQNFDILQVPSGLIYTANATGVMYFDGLKWSLVEGTKNKKYYKLAVDQQGVVYTGGEGDLGYIAPDRNGRMVFVSLLEKMPVEKRDFLPILRVIEAHGTIYFMSKNRLFAWTGSEMMLWEDEYYKIFPSEEGVFVIKAKGIYRLKDNEFHKLGFFGQEPKFDIRCVLDLPKTDQILVLTAESGFFKLEADTIIHIESPLDGVKCINATLLSTGLIAVGTSQEGCLLVSSSGSLHYKINEHNGLLKGPILSPREGIGGSMLLGLSTGIALVEYLDPITQFDPSLGIQPSPLCHLNTQSNYYVGTRIECVSIPKSNNINKAQKFTALPVVTYEVFGLEYFAGKVLIGSWNGIQEWDENKQTATHLTPDQKLTAICRSRSDSNRIWYATPEKSIRSIYYENGRWKDEGERAKLPHRIYNLAESGKGELWASYDGVSRITFLKGGADAMIQTLDSTTGATSEMGLIEVNDLAGKIVFGTERGIHVWDGTKLVPDPTYGAAFSDGSRIAYNLTATRKGDVWVTTNHQTGLLRLQPNGSYVYDSLPIIRAEISDVFSIYEDPEGIMWFGGTEALVRYDPNVPKDYKAPFHALVRSVLVNGDSLLFAGNYADAEGVTVLEQPDAYVHVLPFTCNHLTFSFTAPFFEYPEKLRYSFQLVGQDDDWSKWGTSTTAEYTNLSEGDYVFKVRARNVYGTISTVAEYRFSVLPPWYRTIWAYLGYVLIGILMLVLAARLNARRLIAAKHRLERIIGERTAEVRQQREEIRLEKEVSDKLLLNILPRETANELKLNQEVKPQRFEVVTVLFADIRDFTHISHSLDPEDLVRELNYIFTQMDEIVGKYSLEKIKTIGDAYMCAGGLPVPDPSHPVKMVQAALEMQAFMDAYNMEREREGKPRFDIRIGIHSGPVVAGIVGTRKFQYDIWGDTVNTASRLESSGAPGRVNISESTYELVKDHFQCTWRGKNQVKNRGEIGMYFVDGQTA